MDINNQRGSNQSLVRTTVRLPKELRNLFKKRALKNKTFNSWLIEAMEEELKKSLK
jgi:hypothetical protein